MGLREIPPDVGGDENLGEKLDDGSMEEITDKELGNSEEVEGVTEEQQQEEAEKIQENFRDYAKKRREIADEDFNKEEYERAYARMTEEIKERMDEIIGLLDEGNFGGVRKKTEEAEWEVEKSMGKGKEWLGAGVDFVKVEIIPLLDKIISEETVETLENTAKTLEKKAIILKRMVGCLEEMGGSSKEIITNCNEALSVLKRMRSVEGGEQIYQDGWGVENRRLLQETLKNNGGEVSEE